MNTSNRPGAESSEAAAIESLHELVDAARLGSPKLKDILTRVLASGVSVPPDLLARYGPVAVCGQDFLFLLSTEQTPTISIDEQPPLPMTPIAGTSYWYRLETLRLGTTHNFMGYLDGRPAGGMGGFMP